MRTTMVVSIHKRTITYTLNTPPLQTPFEEHSEGLAVLVSISDDLILITSTMSTSFSVIYNSKIT